MTALDALLNSTQHCLLFSLFCSRTTRVVCVCVYARREKNMDLVSWYLYYIYEQGNYRRVNG